MAVRIRKLARELHRTPAEIVGVLHALGFQRYRSADDMITPVVEAKLRRGLQQGVRPVAVELPDAAEADGVDGLDAVAEAPSDLMAQLVPGVAKAGGRSPARQPVARPQVVAPVREPEPPRPAPVTRVVEAGADLVTTAGIPDPAQVRRAAEIERATLDSLRRALDSERAVLEAERAQLEDERRRVLSRERSLDGDRVSVDELRRALEREREALRTEREVIDALRSRAGGAARGLEELLEERGLRGSDEHERAIEALARGRHLRDLLWSIRVDQPEQLARLLDERLVLVPGEAPEAVTRGAAVVSVAPDRADLPDAATLERLLGQLGERLLLGGHRRVVVAGGRARWHRLLRESLDPRIEARFVPGGYRTRAMATDDVGWADVVVLWGVQLDEAARAIYRSGRPLVVMVEGEALSRFFEMVLGALPP